MFEEGAIKSVLVEWDGEVLRGEQKLSCRLQPQDWFLLLKLYGVQVGHIGWRPHVDDDLAARVTQKQQFVRGIVTLAVECGALQSRFETPTPNDFEGGGMQNLDRTLTQHKQVRGLQLYYARRMNTFMERMGCDRICTTRSSMTCSESNISIYLNVKILPSHVPTRYSCVDGTVILRHTHKHTKLHAIHSKIEVLLKNDVVFGCRHLSQHNKLTLDFWLDEVPYLSKFIFLAIILQS